MVCKVGEFRGRALDLEVHPLRLLGPRQLDHRVVVVPVAAPVVLNTIVSWV